ncbi:hypothetical protein AB0D78_40105 [Streptomyces avermitilis]|uniref:hypothetical protein n=1 Tax=Streptomyces avermitilis TaxID=33903 RepID=UPI0033FDD1D9
MNRVLDAAAPWHLGKRQCSPARRGRRLGLPAAPGAGGLASRFGSPLLVEDYAIELRTRFRQLPRGVGIDNGCSAHQPFQEMTERQAQRVAELPASTSDQPII